MEAVATVSVHGCCRKPLRIHDGSDVECCGNSTVRFDAAMSFVAVTLVAVNHLANS